MNIIKYLAYNAMLVGTVTLATMYKVEPILFVAAWYFGIEAAVYLIAVLTSGLDGFRKAFENKPESLQVWKAVVEPVWIWIMVAVLGNVLFGVYMTFTWLAYTYLLTVKLSWKSKEV